jgi:hypothetical protein
MKIFLGAILTLALSSITLSASAVCPTTANTNTDCGYLITIGPGGALSGAPVAGANPYDGSDDALVGVINNSGSTYNGSITLIGSGNGGGIFAFDGDGICTFTNAAYCATAATGYEGPLNTFANITTTSVFDDTGDVVFSGLAAGGTSYFSLESSPSSIGLVVVGSSAPEPASIAILGSGLVGLFLLRKRIKA